MKKKLLITGASGLLGATALHQLRSLYDVYGIYLRHPIELAGTHCQALDLTDGPSVAGYLSQIQPDIILHTAALINVDECEINREFAYRSNVLATQHLANYAGPTGIKLIYISTDAFFEGQGRLFTENDQPTPVNYYGETKLQSEQLVSRTCPDHLIIRTNLYGWNYQDKLSLAEWMLINLLEGKTIPCVHDVHYAPILTNSCISYIQALLEKNANGLFNVASSRSISKLDFGRMLCAEFGLDEGNIRPSSVNELSFKARRSSNMSLSVKKLSELLGTEVVSPEEDLGRFKRLLNEGYVRQLKGRDLKIPQKS